MVRPWRGPGGKSFNISLKNRIQLTVGEPSTTQVTNSPLVLCNWSDAKDVGKFGGMAMAPRSLERRLEHTRKEDHCFLLPKQQSCFSDSWRATTQRMHHPKSPMSRERCWQCHNRFSWCGSALWESIPREWLIEHHKAHSRHTLSGIVDLQQIDLRWWSYSGALSVLTSNNLCIIIKLFICSIIRLE